jgi:CMP-N-acetylneuraminic acid synthetase
MPSIAALVPMRHHSQRIPGKNYRPSGHPCTIISCALAVPEIYRLP